MLTIHPVVLADILRLPDPAHTPQEFIFGFFEIQFLFSSRQRDNNLQRKGAHLAIDAKASNERNKTRSVINQVQHSKLNCTMSALSDSMCALNDSTHEYSCDTIDLPSQSSHTGIVFQCFCLASSSALWLCMWRLPWQLE